LKDKESVIDQKFNIQIGFYLIIVYTNFYKKILIRKNNNKRNNDG